MIKEGVACAVLVLAGMALMAPARAEDESVVSATPVASKAGASLFAPTPADQLRGMDTDRPNKTNTPHTIDAGHLQIETGFFDFAHDRDTEHGANVTSDAVALGPVNLRLGLLDDLELNLAVDTLDALWSRDHLLGQSVRQQGFGDIVAGGKLNLWGDDGGDDPWATAFAVQPQLKLPTAGSTLGNGHPEFFFGAPFLINLPAAFHLSAQTTVSWERNRGNTGDVTGWQNSASLDRVVFDVVDLYVEYWSHVSTERHQEAQQTFDYGFIYAIDDNVTLDGGVNLGLNKASTGIEVLSGMSVRF